MIEELSIQDKIAELFEVGWNKKKYNKAVIELRELFDKYQEAITSKDLEQATKIYGSAHRKYERHCLAPFTFSKGEKKVLVKLLKTDSVHDEDGGKKIISFAVMTPQMLLTDYGFFSRNAYWLDHKNQQIEKTDYFYKPFYYELDIYPDDNMYFERFKGELSKKDDGWYFAKLIRNDNPEGEGLKKWESLTNIPALLCFSNSPYTTEEVFFHLLDKVVDDDLEKMLLDLDDTPDASGYDTKVDATLTKISGIFERPSNAVIYNVGQANCIYLYLHIKGEPFVKRVFFDIGRPFDKVDSKRNPDLEQNKPAYTSLNNITGCKPSVIIISHWHSDHFLAALTLGRCVYEATSDCEWIAPLPNEEVLSKYKRLINFLLIRKKIKFVDYKKFVSSGVIFQKGHFSLYQGQGTGSDLNESSMLLKINTSLFAGDCMYRFWPDCLQAELKTQDSIKQMVVPHHGSGLSNDDLILTKNATGCTRKEAVISAGTNIWGHPIQKHITELINMGFLSPINFNSAGSPQTIVFNLY